MGNNDLNGDEFETIIDLIVMVLFMGMAFYGAFQMSQILGQRINVYDSNDKIRVTLEDHEADDPFWFTGYQAYMFAWHMDDQSAQALSWVSDDDPDIDDDSYEYDITMCRDYINDVSITSSFIPLRNRYIVGTGYAEDTNLRKVIEHTAPSEQFKLYRGLITNSSGERLLYHLSLTDKFTRYSALGVDPNAGGKKYSWVLEPLYH